MPRRRAVCITRQAISPRLAIRMRSNISTPPRRPPLLEEGGDALAPLRADADGGDALHRQLDQPRIDDATGDVGDQRLGLALRLRPAFGERPEHAGHRLVEP